MEVGDRVVNTRSPPAGRGAMVETGPRRRLARSAGICCRNPVKEVKGHDTP
jgi:hypothetical protein